MTLIMQENDSEIARRRTFGIISHPDAGKTTLTEKLLLFGGAIQLAGSVKAKKSARHATSDWMAMERERGISVSTSVMRFCYQGYEVNLLDTPGHQDFSEDTYRVLTAVDSALLVIDAAKGVEEQTKKLMDVCRMRNTPIITFINKLDREGLAPLDVMADIEKNLHIDCAPLTWPVGMGSNFKGCYDLRTGEMALFSPTNKGQVQDAHVVFKGLDDANMELYLGEQANDLRSDMELLSTAGTPFSLDRYLSGSLTPVFFGSAINNFGIGELLSTFVRLAPAPRPRAAINKDGDVELIAPENEEFSGVVFKIQANMDRSHRDRMAFMRICSGKFQRGMKLRHHRLNKEVTIHNATIFMAQDRVGVEDAYPGDIIGMPNHGTIKIGDTFTEKTLLKFTGIPHFAPEHFRRVVLRNPIKAKGLQKGLQQLAEEGAVQLFRPLINNDYILGAVGVLQFDVIISRLSSEYGVEASYEHVSAALARWVKTDNQAQLKKFMSFYRSELALDEEGTLAYLAPSPWILDLVMERFPAIEFKSTREIN